MSATEFRRLRHLAGLTQEQAAHILEVSHRTILRWESGESRIKPLKARAIRLILGERVFHNPGEVKAKAAYVL